MKHISVVIPTKDRIDDLVNLINCLKKQTIPPSEVLIIDSSDNPVSIEELPELSTIKLIRSEPSVCIQRNIGIRQSKGDYILLCDDDVEFAEYYIEQLLDHLQMNKNVVAVTGLWYQKDEKEHWDYCYPPRSVSEVLKSWLFGLSIWGPVDEINPPMILKPIYYYLRNFYNDRSNFITKAGWPVYHDFKNKIIRTKVTSLGSALIRSEDLKKALYDEVLDPYGYGDNYDVCAKLTMQGQEINVIKSLIVKHYQSSQNRAALLLARYRRILALAYFVKMKKHFNTSFSFFIWSLTGLLLASAVTLNLSLFAIYLKAYVKVIFNRNPYVTGSKNGEKVIKP